jgi:hypothetical protein
MHDEYVCPCPYIGAPIGKLEEQLLAGDASMRADGSTPATQYPYAARAAAIKSVPQPRSSTRAHRVGWLKCTDQPYCLGSSPPVSICHNPSPGIHQGTTEPRVSRSQRTPMGQFRHIIHCRRRRRSSAVGELPVACVRDHGPCHRWLSRGGTMSDADNDRECTAADGWARAYTT